jgi:hypothetical protein
MGGDSVVAPDDATVGVLSEDQVKAQLSEFRRQKP